MKIRFTLALIIIALQSNAQGIPTQVTQPAPDTTDKDEFDRPDLAMEQLFRFTSDPALGYPPVERLQNVFSLIKNQRISQTMQSVPLTSLANANWVERGPSNVGGRTRALMFDPNDTTHKKVWAGGVDGGVWYTNDITASTPTWTNVNEFWANMAISCITYDPANTLIFYVGTGEGWFNVDAAQGQGIWKTTDGGVTWNQLASTSGNDNFDFVNRIAVDDSGNVYAATRSIYCNEGGIFKSTNGGTTWSLVLGTQASTCAASNCYGADLKIGADGTIYATLGIFYTGGIYKSTNNGSTWTQINTATNGFPTAGFQRIEIAVAPSDANRLYAMVQDTSTALLNIYTSDNKGSSWTTCALPSWHDNSCTTSSTDMTRGQAWYDLIIAVDPNNASNVLVGGVDIMKSTNAGTSWSQITSWWGGCSLPYIHADQHAIAFQPGSSSNAVFGNDGGIFYSTNVNASTPAFSSKDNGYNVTQFYACAIHPTAGTNYFLAGAQDNGTQQFTTSGMNATNDIIGGDGVCCFIDQTNATYQIGSYTNNNYYRSTNNWSSYTTISSSSTTGDFINPAAYDNANHILYSSYSSSKLQRISGINATPASPVQITITGMTANAGNICVSPYAPTGTTTLFVGTQNGQLYKVTNAQATPAVTNISGTAAPWGTSATISCVAVGASESNLLVTFSNYGVVSVWRTANGGTTWTNVEGNLPDMPVWWALYNPTNLNQVFLGTEVGVWSTDSITAASPDWVANNSGLANVRVYMLQLRASDNTIIAATHGRGLFSTNVLTPVTPVANFSASVTTVCAGSTVIYTDLSTNSPTSWSWTFPGGTPSSSTLQNPSVTYSTAGTYSVSLTASNVSGSNTLTKTNYMTVNVIPTISAGGTTTFCSGGSVTLTASAGSGYLWSTGATTSSINVTATARDSVAENGCTSPATVVTVNALPTPTISGTLTFCSGSSTTLSTGSNSSYHWSTGATTSSINVSTAGTFTVSVTNNNGCTGTSSAVTTTVNPLPTPSISGTLAFCTGSFTTLSTGSYSSYLWSTGATTSSINVSPASTFSVTVTNSNGCTGSSSSVSTTVNPLPTPTVSGTLAFCSGSSTTLSAGSYSSYFWSTGATTSSINVSTAGTFSVTVTNSNGCAGTSAAVTTTVTNCSTAFTMKFYIQGYYLGGGMMQQVLYNEGVDPNPTSTKVDTITVSLVDSVLLAHDANDNSTDADTVATAKGVLQTNGSLSVTFPGSVAGHKCYIMFTDRNILQTWSANTVTISNGGSYNFTTSACAAYGCNQVDVYKEGIWSFYSGDLNQDQNIDIYDFPVYDFESSHFYYGYYVGDLNGDGNVDIYDFPVFDANSGAFIYSEHP